MNSHILCAALTLILVSACGPAASSTPSGGSGAGKASIDLTVSGDLQAKTTVLAKYHCAGAQYGTYSDTFKPVIDGSEYDLALLLGQFKGSPATYNFATPENHILLDFHNDKAGWRNNDHTTGTITIDAGGDSGTVDAHSMESGIGIYLTKVDLKFTFTCPTEK